MRAERIPHPKHNVERNVCVEENRRQGALGSPSSVVNGQTITTSDAVLNEWLKSQGIIQKLECAVVSYQSSFLQLDTRQICVPEGIEQSSSMGTPSTATSPLPFSRRWIPSVFVLVLKGALAQDAEAFPPDSKAPRPSTSDWSYSATLGLSNDNLPAPALFAPADRLDPSSSSFADDDGRTFGIVFEQALTNERQGLQFLISTWYEMLTQDGAQEDPSRDLRADVLNNVFQANQRFDFDRGWSLFMGMGLGVQTVGDLNGIALQSWWHAEGGFGGRLLNQGLQDDYGDMRGSVTTPAISHGLRIGKRFGDENGWHARVSAGSSALIVLGRTGMSIGQADLGGRVGHPRRAEFWAEVLVSSGTANDEYLRFAPIQRGAWGYEFGASLHWLHQLRIPVSPNITIQSNGSGLADTTFTLGLQLGRGPLPWIRPPR